MKKLLCILLSCILVFNSFTVVYADEHGGSGGSFDPIVALQEKHPDWFDENGHVKPTGSELFNHMIVKGLLPTSAEGGIASLYGLIGDYTKNYDNSDGSGATVHYHDNGQPVTESNYNENNFYITFSPKFLNGLNDKLQNKIYALDGYYLITPLKNYTCLNDVWKNSTFSDSDNKKFTLCASDSNLLFRYTRNSEELYFFDTINYYYFFGDNGGLAQYDIVNNKFSTDNTTSPYYIHALHSLVLGNNGIKYSYLDGSSIHGVSALTNNVKDISNFQRLSSGHAFKVFYSKKDLQNYLNSGKTRSYVPKLPSTNLTIPLGYANGTLNLPDFNIKLDSLIGKAEADIQADIDNQFKLYLDKLAEINVNPSQPTNPTPTPSGGGSGGDFGDGTTPTPAPDFTDGLKDTNDLLTQILEKVTSILQVDTDFSKSFETVSQNLCKYLESNNEKLDQIITAINALSNGKTEDEVNGCKYDFTQLSQSLTSLWNDSDQKFDQMIKLLEENNKYQEKIIGDLNDIKAILIAQTVLDAFQNRSKETADKAKEKFPTSIPWDIAMIVNTFSAEPQPIKFELPIKVNSLNINETITVDLSTGEWEKLGKLCRYMLSVLFILFLIQLSRKLFSNGGDE